MRTFRSADHTARCEQMECKAVARKLSHDHNTARAYGLRKHDTLIIDLVSNHVLTCILIVICEENNDTNNTIYRYLLQNVKHPGFFKKGEDIISWYSFSLIEIYVNLFSVSILRRR